MNLNKSAFLIIFLTLVYNPAGWTADKFNAVRAKVMQDMTDYSVQHPNASKEELAAKQKALFAEAAEKLKPPAKSSGPNLSKIKKPPVDQSKISQKPTEKGGPGKIVGGSKDTSKASSKTTSKSTSGKESKSPAVVISNQKRTHTTGAEGAEAGGAEPINFGSPKKSNDADDGLNH